MVDPVSLDEPEDWRVDELARRAGIATTTVRLYRTKGLLPPPRLVGRTGFYGPRHLTRLRAIARLQSRGFSLAAIAELLDRWERGDGLATVVGADAGAAALLGDRHAIVLTLPQLLERLPLAALEPESLQRAASLGVIEPPDEHGRFHIPDSRFLDAGAALIGLGVPIDVILDEWVALRDVAEQVAVRFADVFERHLLPDESRTTKDVDGVEALLVELRTVGQQVLLAAFDEALARVAVERFAGLTPPTSDG